MRPTPRRCVSITRCGSRGSAGSQAPGEAGGVDAESGPAVPASGHGLLQPGSPEPPVPASLRHSPRPRAATGWLPQGCQPRVGPPATPEVSTGSEDVRAAAPAGGVIKASPRTSLSAAHGPDDLLLRCPRFPPAAALLPPRSAKRLFFRIHFPSCPFPRTTWAPQVTLGPGLPRGSGLGSYRVPSHREAPPCPVAAASPGPALAHL